MALVLVAAAVVQSGSSLLDHADELQWQSLVLGELAVLGGLLSSLMAWRALLADLGSPLPFVPATRVFFLGQLGKYVPGSVWPVVAQMEMAKELGVPRARSGPVGLLTVALALVAGLLVAAVTLPFTSSEALASYWWAFAAVPLLGVLLLPPVANPLLSRLLRLARRDGLEQPLSGRALAVALLWSAGTWLGFGVQMWLLVRSLGATDEAALLPLAVGAFALAWTAGFLFVIAPAGAGVREVALVVGLAPVLGRDEALLAALASRALMTLGDGICAAVAIVLARRHGSRLDGAKAAAS